jgi:hypothetical protein
LPSCGTVIVPRPHGHSPAIARNSVLFPVPRFALDQDALARLDLERGVLHDHGAVGMRDVEVAHDQAVAVAALDDDGILVVVGEVLARSSSESTKVTIRITLARQSAMRVKLSTNQLKAVCTETNAVAICIRPPSVISLAKYCGAATMTGNAVASTA